MLLNPGGWRWPLEDVDGQHASADGVTGKKKEEGKTKHSNRVHPFKTGSLLWILSIHSMAAKSSVPPGPRDAAASWMLLWQASCTYEVGFGPFTSTGCGLSDPEGESLPKYPSHPHSRVNVALGYAQAVQGSMYMLLRYMHPNTSGMLLVQSRP